MATAQHYEIVPEKEVIRFDVDKITQAEMKKIKKLAKGFGYALEPYTAEKKTNEAFTEKTIREFLADKPEALALYEAKYNAPMIDKKTGKPVLLKNDSKDGKRKAGEPRVKGHVATLQWFKKRFPEYPKGDKEDKTQK